MNQPYKVYVVIDPEFGERLESLPIGVPVWVVNTPSNAMAVERIWQKSPIHDHLVGITTYKFDPGVSREENLTGILESIDLHHGVYSADPPYSEIEVFGTALSEKIKDTLVILGFQHSVPTGEGFKALRKPD